MTGVNIAAVERAEVSAMNAKRPGRDMNRLPRLGLDRLLRRLFGRLARFIAPAGFDEFETPPLRDGLEFGVIAESAELPAAEIEIERAAEIKQRELARRLFRSTLYPPRQ